MKRLITIIIIIIIASIVILGGAWLLNRKTAEKNGLPAPTFKEFLSGKQSGSGEDTVGPNGNLASEFVDNTIVGVPTGPVNSSNTSTSVFTNNTVSPTSSTGAGSTGGTTTGNAGTTGGGSNGGTTTGGTGGNTGTTGGGSNGGTNNTPTGGTPTLMCTAADTTISFTAEEQARLRLLKARFDATVEILKGESAIAIETSNYDGFKIMEQKIQEMLNYCQAKEPLLTDPKMKVHVATPFWRNPNQDAPGLSGYLGGLGLFNRGFLQSPPSNIVPFGLSGLSWTQYQNTVNNASALSAKRTLEHALRLNLW